MSETNLTDVWIEAQVDDNHISLTLLSESQNGAKVEEIKSFTLNELTEMSGEIFSMNLSDETREAIQSTPDLNIIEIPEDTGENNERDTSNTGDYTLPNTGDIVHDTEGPNWSDNTRMKVTDVLWNTPAEEFTIKDDSIYEKTVYSVNNCEPDEPVIMARYVEGSGDEYAFPVSRLEF